MRHHTLNRAAIHTEWSSTIAEPCPLPCMCLPRYRTNAPASTVSVLPPLYPLRRARPGFGNADHRTACVSTQQILNGPTASGQRLVAAHPYQGPSTVPMNISVSSIPKTGMSTPPPRPGSILQRHGSGLRLVHMPTEICEGRLLVTTISCLTATAFHVVATLPPQPLSTSSYAKRGLGSGSSRPSTAPMMRVLWEEGG